MKRQLLAVAVLLWLGWYLSGPLCETFDFGDPPRVEVHDIERNAGGVPVLIAAIFSFAIFVIRRLRERCLFLAQVLRGQSLLLVFCLPLFSVATCASSHSPPLPALRI